MSHASLLVAVEVVDPTDRGEIEAAVSFQMEPYDEKGEWFRDGSRWDWWVIGGRFTGLLSDYDPRKDPRNWSACPLCHGTGTRPGGREEFGEEWFSATKGCNGCGGTGKAMNWTFADFGGDIVQVKDLKPGQAKPAYAFLCERHWHEGERMGFFGMPAATECELKAGGDPDVMVRRCLTIGDEDARVVTWQEPPEVWDQEFVKRFIEPLKPETVLVVVDYHV